MGASDLILSHFCSQCITSLTNKAFIRIHRWFQKYLNTNQVFYWCGLVYHGFVYLNIQTLCYCLIIWFIRRTFCLNRHSQSLRSWKSKHLEILVFVEFIQCWNLTLEHIPLYQIISKLFTLKVQVLTFKWGDCAPEELMMKVLLPCLMPLCKNYQTFPQHQKRYIKSQTTL